MSAPPTPNKLFGSVRHVLLVLSGKGGVGKSTVACQLAFYLSHVLGHRVGILDVDICGPSVPKICGVENRNIVQTESGGWLPVTVDASTSSRKAPAVETAPSSSEAPTASTGGGATHQPSVQGGSLKVMSIAFLLPSSTDAVVWRGPRKDAMIKQFVNDVVWGELDYLIVDTPPGTSDEHLTLCELLKDSDPTGAIVVTTPQLVSTDDVRKELSFCHKLKVRCLGIVENMSGYVCPHCTTCTPIFGSGGGQMLATQYEVPFLGAIPLDPLLSLTEDQGESFLVKFAAAPPSSTDEGSTATATTHTAPLERPSVKAIRVMMETILEHCKRVDAVREGRQKPSE